VSRSVALEGFHCVKHALRFAPDLVLEVRVRDRERTRALAERLAPDVAAALADRAVVADPAHHIAHHTGVEGTGLVPEHDRSVLRSRSAPLVLLDRPRSPGNAGAVVRVAAAAGASGVACTGPLDPWHPTVLRGSAGLHYALPVLRLRPDELPAGPYAVLDAGGDPDGVLTREAVLVVGTERDGVGADLRARADLVLALPMRPGVSSLNLATATAAALYRQR
jgi:TrmH family RNA methyltransferase